MNDSLLDILEKYWGYTSFRPKQREIIESVLAGRDTLALMPTGGGKSITYQLPTLFREGLCIVVTPLIALMKDQVDRLRRRGINAVAVHSGVSARQIDIDLDNCVYGDVKFLYLAPERLTSEIFRLRVQKMNVSLLAIDEAHCISQWGYDFRPSYLRIAELRRLIPGTPVLALTASATPLVVDDIMNRLDFSKPNIMRSSFARPNISYAVRHVDDKEGQLMRIIKNVPGSGIIYVRLREAAEKIAESLRDSGISADYYHGGLPHNERNMRQDDWVSGKTRIIVATNAFGMGIDKADVRFVVHYSMCDSLESYYQEAGRAGRDGKHSYAVLLVSPDDVPRIRRRFEQEFPKIEIVKSIYERLCSYLQVAIGDGFQSSFIFNIHEFCAREHLFQGTVVSALKLLQQNGYLTLTDETDNPARLMFCISRDDLYKIRTEQHNLDTVLRAILRLYDGVFTEFRAIDEMQIATACDYTTEKVHDLLKQMWRMHIIRYIPSTTAPMIFFNEERLPINNIYIAPETYTGRKELMMKRLADMQQYAANETECRSSILERYFGDVNATPCGVCDICLKRKKQTSCYDPDIIGAYILMELKSSTPSVKALVDKFGNTAETIIPIIRKLLDSGQIYTDDSGRLHLKKGGK